mgnify:CR=1 FL=1
MSINIVEVVSKKNLKKWVEFPNKLYKDVDAYVPFLFSDEMATFTKDKNPAYEFCETKLFLAYIGKRNNSLITFFYVRMMNENSIGEKIGCIF